MCDECTVSFKGLEHPQILTSVGGPRPNMPWRQRVNSILPSGNNWLKLSAVRCGTHWYLNCSCTDVAICWDACNVSRQFLWVLTFLKRMATCAKEGEASVGTGALRNREEADAHTVLVLFWLASGLHTMEFIHLALCGPKDPQQYKLSIWLWGRWSRNSGRRSLCHFPDSGVYVPDET